MFTALEVGDVIKTGFPGLPHRWFYRNNGNVHWRLDIWVSSRNALLDPVLHANSLLMRQLGNPKGFKRRDWELIEKGESGFLVSRCRELATLEETIAVKEAAEAAESAKMLRARATSSRIASESVLYSLSPDLMT